jgi:hypothetical protein
LDRFIDVLIDNWYIPQLCELDNIEITDNIQKAFIDSKNNKFKRINI